MPFFSDDGFLKCNTDLGESMEQPKYIFDLNISIDVPMIRNSVILFIKKIICIN